MQLIGNGEFGLDFMVVIKTVDFDGVQIEYNLK